MLVVAVLEEREVGANRSFVASQGGLFPEEVSMSVLRKRGHEATFDSLGILKWLHQFQYFGI